MKTTHTNTFIGGPWDGRQHAVFDDGDRKYVEVLGSDLPPLSRPGKLSAAPVYANVTRRLYEKAAIQCGDEETYLYWRDEALSDADVVRKLFERYLLLR